MKVTLPLGTFPLRTPWETIHGAWVDERATSIVFSDGVEDCTAEAVFRLSSSPDATRNGPSELRGHTLEPEGFNLRALRQTDGPADIEITRRN